MRIITLSVLACLALEIPASVAQDYDQRWIRRTIRQQHSATVAEHEHRYHGVRHRRSYYYTRPRSIYYHPRPQYRYWEERRRDRDYYDRDSRRDGGKVHGVHYFAPQRVERDILSNTECLPHLSAISHEHQTEEIAQRNAKRAWEALVRWRIGERFANAANAREKTARMVCSKTSVAESAAERASEGLAKAFGGDGHKHRCELIAQPCPPDEEHAPRLRD